MIDTATAGGLVSAVLNGFVAGVPLVCAVWVALRLSRRWVNAATRYCSWWIVLAAVALLPFAYAPSALAPIALKARTLRAIRDAGAIARPGAPAQLPVQIQPRRRAPVLPVALSTGVWCARFIELWMLMAIAMGLRLLVSYAILARRKRRAFDARDDLKLFVQASLARFGSRRHVRVAVAATAASPMVAGPLRPAILLPATLLAAMEPEEIEQVCLHEAAHVSRYDDWMLLVQRVIEAAFAVHPLVRWISRQIHLEREIACDDIVISTTGNARPYAVCLTRVAELAGGFSPGPAAAAATDESSHLTRRVEMLLDRTRSASVGVAGRRFGILALGVSLIALAAARTPRLLAIVPAPQAVVRTAITHKPVVIAQVRPPRTPIPPTPAPIETRQMRTVSVTVTDPGGRFVTGLDRSAFQIFQGGAEQTIQESRADDHVPVLVMVRRGGDGRQNLAQTPGAELQVIAAGEGATFLENLRGAAAALRAQNTNRSGLVIVESADAPAALWTESEINEARGADVPVYTIGLKDKLGSMAEFISDVTGGAQFHTADAADLPRILDTIGVELRSQYLLGYGAGNTQGKVEVRVSPPQGLPHLDLRFRVRGF